MSLFKKGENWYIDYYLDGRRKREAVGPNRKVAERALAKRQVQVAENRFLDIVQKSKVTFEHLSDSYLKYAETNKSSWKRDWYSLRSLKSALGGKQLHQITPLSIEGYKNARSQAVSPATVNRELACLKHMFTKAIQWQMTSSNPVKMVKMLKENNERLRYLQTNEVHKLMEQLPDRLRPIVNFALYTGMRKGEILNLKWEDLDFGQKIIFVKNTKNGEMREIPMAEAVFNELKSWPHRTTYVFCDSDGTRITSIKGAYSSAVKRAGISDFTFHDLRHTFASHLAMSGVDLLTIKELLGHKSINMTLRYAHLSPNHKRKAIASLKYLDGHFLDTKPIGPSEAKDLTYDEIRR